MERLSTSWYGIPEDSDPRPDFEKWLEGELTFEELSSADKKKARALLKGSGSKKKSAEQLTEELHDIVEEFKKTYGQGQA